MKPCCDKNSDQQQASLTIALVGNPNCGKTTLFNALTGARQHVGNWPGVTVERKSGYFSQACHTVQVVDLPGVYTLTQVSETSAIDEQIAAEFIRTQQANVIVNIVDAGNLERHLYLTTQLLEMGVPLILALNMMDVARDKHIHIDVKALSKELGCPVVALEANKGGGVCELKRAMVEFDVKNRVQKDIPYPEEIVHAIQVLGVNPWVAIRLLENDVYMHKLLLDESSSHGLDPAPARGMTNLDAAGATSLDAAASMNTAMQVRVQDNHSDLSQRVREQQTLIQQTTGEDADILIADARYRFVNQVFQQCVTRSATPKTSWTTRIDNIVLNRVFGIPIFLAIMYLLFVFSINIGGAFQDFFDISSQTIFVDGFAYWLNHLGAPTWLIALLADGIGKGINTVVTFIPVIGSMFLFLALLEDSGYMARAAFVIDRFMRALGLPGKAFVPMIVGFGCNVPAVMGARTLENKRDRILTIMMTPFMSCGARLAIFAVFTTAFFPVGGQNIVFALYLIGIIMAVLTGVLLRHTVLKGDPSPLVMELPLYHMPRMKTLLLHAWQRLKGFVYRAGFLIVPICVLIGALNALNIDGSMNTGEGDAQSLLSLVGQWVTPIFSPMGMHVDNWPATVGLVTGVLAKEVVIGTLNTLYSQVGHFADAVSSANGFDLWAGLSQAVKSIPQNLSQISSVFSNPVLAQAPIDTVNQGVYGLMYQRFDGQVGAFAYLLFVLLYFPCVSTMAVMMRELHRGWSVFSGFWMTGVAYGTAVTFYQAATWTRHPLSSSLWILGVATVFLGTIAAVRWYANKDNKISNINHVLPVGETA